MIGNIKKDKPVTQKADAPKVSVCNNLIISRFLEISDEESLNKDYKMMDFLIACGTYAKGFNTDTIYYTKENDPEIVVIETYSLRIKKDPQILVGIDTKVELMNTDGSVGATKFYYKPFTPYESAEYLKNQRSRAVGGILEIYKGSKYEAPLFSIFERYKGHIYSYIEFGSAALSMTVENENDPLVCMILNSVDDAVTGNKTLKQIILEGLT